MPDCYRRIGIRRSIIVYDTRCVCEYGSIIIIAVSRLDQGVIAEARVVVVAEGVSILLAGKEVLQRAKTVGSALTQTSSDGV